ncbi:MAG: helix-turn-helix domain-containing protein [Acidobacteriia bacterium]|nr:helix-turn-helix domain-containing protein [Terriglobia bacterium]
MLARLLRLHPSTYKRLVRLSKEAEQDGAYRVARRLQAVVRNSEGQTSSELARILKAPRSKVSEWLHRYQTEGVDGLLEGYRSGRPSELTDKHWALIFTDEASFRQNSTLHATWSRVRCPPEVPLPENAKA